MPNSVAVAPLPSDKGIAVRDRLIFALDVPSVEQAKRLVEQLDDAVCFYKLGLELFMAGGYFDLIEWLRARDKKVFVDLKFFDVPQTVGLAVARLHGRGVRFATVHGNDAMLAAACEARGDVGILAVTALTSLDQGDLDDLGFKCDPQALVLSRARRALAVGCDGVIASGLEAPALRADLGQRLMIVTPGIRPVVNRDTDDHKRAVDVQTAFGNGADHIVIGRPIRDAALPKQAAEQIQTRIATLFGT